ncbi:hypothetical protein Desaci_1365 [Desulfosporosinus acidiphilus SJ4]|uniref:Uncharacterized protein n=1 Tax=Desulfosporosinus acidiphilus (strain DSM 22704 / JCM 16185 / SJ4) TaxID=646529 RepID=I4D3L5_DESAJ|nr:hypothetical protein Desaci_1365 [Desulfosporosinus acidiphilus SJ4]
MAGLFLGAAIWEAEDSAGSFRFLSSSVAMEDRGEYFFSLFCIWRSDSTMQVKIEEGGVVMIVSHR